MHFYVVALRCTCNMPCAMCMPCVDKRPLKHTHIILFHFCFFFFLHFSFYGFFYTLTEWSGIFRFIPCSPALIKAFAPVCAFFFFFCFCSLPFYQEHIQMLDKPVLATRYKRIRAKENAEEEEEKKIATSLKACAFIFIFFLSLSSFLLLLHFISFLSWLVVVIFVIFFVRSFCFEQRLRVHAKWMDIYILWMWLCARGTLISHGIQHWVYSGIQALRYERKRMKKNTKFRWEKYLTISR